MISRILESIEQRASVLLLGAHSFYVLEIVKSKLENRRITFVCKAEFFKHPSICFSDYLCLCFQHSAASNSLLVIESIEDLFVNSDCKARVELLRLFCLYKIPIVGYSTTISSFSIVKEYFDVVFEVMSVICGDDCQTLGARENISYKDFALMKGDGHTKNGQANFRPIRWDQVGGMRAIKEAVWEAASATLQTDADLHLRYLQLGCRAACGILLHGPPGTGKTLIARALATELSGCSFISASIGELLHSHVGESEQAIDRLFAEGRAAQPSIIFLDELDALFSGKGVSGVGRKLTAQLVHQFDELFRNKGRVLIIGATNHIESVDERLLGYGRFDLVLKVECPDDVERADILATLNVPEDLVKSLVKSTKGMSGAEMAQFVQLGRQNALSRQSNQMDFNDFNQFTE